MSSILDEATIQRFVNETGCSDAAARNYLAQYQGNYVVWRTTFASDSYFVLMLSQFQAAKQGYVRNKQAKSESAKKTYDILFH